MRERKVALINSSHCEPENPGPITQAYDAMRNFIIPQSCAKILPSAFSSPNLPPAFSISHPSNENKLSNSRTRTYTAVV